MPYFKYSEIGTYVHGRERYVLEFWQPTAPTERPLYRFRRCLVGRSRYVIKSFSTLTSARSEARAWGLVVAK